MTPNIAETTNGQWDLPCEAAYDWLAVHDPDYLQDWIESCELPPADLTFAAEACMMMTSHRQARATLRPLLTHASPVVREGALYGVSDHLYDGDDDLICHSIQQIARHDTSPAVRASAVVALGRPLPPPRCPVCAGVFSASQWIADSYHMGYCDRHGLDDSDPFVVRVGRDELFCDASGRQHRIRAGFYVIATDWDLIDQHRAPDYEAFCDAHTREIEKLSVLA